MAKWQTLPTPATAARIAAIHYQKKQGLALICLLLVATPMVLWGAFEALYSVHTMLSALPMLTKHAIFGSLSIWVLYETLRAVAICTQMLGMRKPYELFCRIDLLLWSTLLGSDSQLAVARLNCLGRLYGELHACDANAFQLIASKLARLRRTHNKALLIDVEDWYKQFSSNESKSAAMIEGYTYLLIATNRSSDVKPLAKK